MPLLPVATCIVSRHAMVAVGLLFGCWSLGFPKLLFTPGELKVSCSKDRRRDGRFCEETHRQRLVRSTCHTVPGVSRQEA